MFYIYCVGIIFRKRLFFKVGSSKDITKRINDFKKNYHYDESCPTKVIKLFHIKINNANLIESNFHKKNKLHSKDVNVYTNVWKSKSIECYPDNEEIRKILYNFFIETIETYKNVKYYISSYVMNYIKQSSLYILNDSKIYTKPILDCPNIVPYDIEEGSICAIYVENEGWQEGIIKQVNKRKTLKPNLTIYFLNDNTWSDILATKGNYGIDQNIDQCWCLI